MRLETYLTERCIPVEKFATDLGVSATAVYRYLNGERYPRAKIISKIKELTNGMVGGDDFLAEKE